MLTASRALGGAAESHALPRVEELKSLYEYGFLPRAAQMLMIAGPPGAGKSAFGMWYAQRMNLRTLYFSADMDSHTAITRLAAVITGYETNTVADSLTEGGIGYFQEALEGSNIQFCFDSGPTLDDMADEIDAYVEIWDAFPEVIVCDNLMNLEVGDGSEEFAGLRLICKELHRMARETGAAVIVLHHAAEHSDPLVPAPRKLIQGKVSQLPERILTVALNPDEGSYRIACVKNRGGRQDPTGGTFFRLSAYPERASFGPWTGVRYRPAGGYE